VSYFVGATIVSNTNTLNFSLKPVEIEAREKVSSMMAGPEDSEAALLTLCSEKLPEPQFKNVKRTLSYARSLDSTNASHPSMRAYFSHPVRVAKLALQLLDQPSEEIVSMGLLHNVFEVTGLTEGDLLESGYSERMASGIRLTTIDRERQYDEAYLIKFYDRIKQFGDDLALIKCVDKLDNLLAFELFERTPEIERYLALGAQFVVPLASQLSSDLGAYVQQTIDFMRSAGCNNSLRTQYQLFLTETEVSAR